MFNRKGSKFDPNKKRTVHVQRPKSDDPQSTGYVRKDDSDGLIDALATIAVVEALSDIGSSSSPSDSYSSSDSCSYDSGSSSSDCGGGGDFGGGWSDGSF